MGHYTCVGAVCWLPDEKHSCRIAGCIQQAVPALPLPSPSAASARPAPAGVLELPAGARAPAPGGSVPAGASGAGRHGGHRALCGARGAEGLPGAAARRGGVGGRRRLEGGEGKGGCVHHAQHPCPLIRPLAPPTLLQVYANDLNPASYRYLCTNIKINRLGGSGAGGAVVLPFCADGRAFMRQAAAGQLDVAAAAAVVPAPPPRKPKHQQQQQTKAAAAEGAAGAGGEEQAAVAVEAGQQPPSEQQQAAAPPPLSSGSRCFHHVVMNLPASAVEFLDALRGAFCPQLWRGQALPLVHVYTFATGEDEVAGGCRCPLIVPCIALTLQLCVGCVSASITARLPALSLPARHFTLQACGSVWSGTWGGRWTRSRRCTWCGTWHRARSCAASPSACPLASRLQRQRRRPTATMTGRPSGRK